MMTMSDGNDITSRTGYPVRSCVHTHTSYTVVEGMRRDVRILLVGDGSFLSVPFILPWRQA